MTRLFQTSIAAALLVLAFGCSSNADRHAVSRHVRPLTSPAGPHSTAPGLFATPDGDVYLSWLEASGDGHRFLFSQLRDTVCSDPRTVTTGANWFVNWADVPSVVATDDGRLTAHLLAKSGQGPYAYDVRLLQSADGGRTWSRPVTPHDDDTATEHGFASLLPLGDGRTFVTWLDGRHFAPSPDGRAATNEMTLRAAVLAADGSLTDATVLDDRTCDCCQTSAAATRGGLFVAYRDRSDAEVRDIAYTRLRDGAWSEPRVVHADGWTIEGCPVNGPAVDAQDDRVAVAWFTGARDSARVQVAFSSDEGASFASPVTISDERPLGRVAVRLLPDGSALVAWMETADGGAELRVRRVEAAGPMDAPVTVATLPASRASGFPRMVLATEGIYFAWTDPSADAPRVQTALLPWSDA